MFNFIEFDSCHSPLLSIYKEDLFGNTHVLLFLEKIIELVEQSKGWSSVDQTKQSAQNVMMGISEEELYGLPTAEYVHRRGGFIFRELTVYHVAFHACADLMDVEVHCE